MNFNDFRKYIETDCLHETIYDDSEGRQILVIRMLDAYEMAWQMSMKAVLEEREACAKLAEQTVCDTHLPTNVKIYGSRAAKAIRARSNT